MKAKTICEIIIVVLSIHLSGFEKTVDRPSTTLTKVLIPKEIAKEVTDTLGLLILKASNNEEPQKENRGSNVNEKKLLKVKFRDPNSPNCSQYYKCNARVKKCLDCQHFSAKLRKCVDIQDAKCTKITGRNLKPHQTSCNKYYKGNDTEEWTCTAGEHFSEDQQNCVSNQITECDESKCKYLKECEKFAHPRNYTSYCACYNGTVEEYPCPNGTYFHTEYLKCYNTTLALLPDPDSCKRYKIFRQGKVVDKECPPGKFYNQNKKKCTFDESVCIVPNIILLPHPEECHKYLICDREHIIEQICPNRMHFDEEEQKCKTLWKYNSEGTTPVPKKSTVKVEESTKNLTPNPMNCNELNGIKLCEHPSNKSKYLLYTNEEVTEIVCSGGAHFILSLGKCSDLPYKFSPADPRSNNSDTNYVLIGMFTLLGFWLGIIATITFIMYREKLRPRRPQNENITNSETDNILQR